MSSVSHITRNITDLYTDATQIPRAFKNTTNLDFLDNNVSNSSRDITNSRESLENAPVWLIIVNVLICMDHHSECCGIFVPRYEPQGHKNQYKYSAPQFKSDGHACWNMYYSCYPDADNKYLFKI